MKKLIAGLLSVTMLMATTVVTSSAAQTSTEATSAGQYRIEELPTRITLPNNTLQTYTYGFNQENNPRPYGTFTNFETNERYFLSPSNDDLNTPQTITVSKGDYDIRLGGGNSYNRYNFDNTGGTYVLTRFKLSDFSNYFNDNGTRTETYISDGYTHDFNFTKESDGNTSKLAILSGGYVNFVAPDKDGYVQAYLFKKVNADVEIYTTFHSKNGTGGGGTIALSFSYLIVGDLNNDRRISLEDAVLLQKRLADGVNFNSAQNRNADVNGDGDISLEDAVILQKYLASINV